MSDEVADALNDAVEDVSKQQKNGNEKDIIEEIYNQHGGDPRKLDISYVVLLSRLPTDFLADTYEQFLECIKNLLAEEHKLDPNSLKQVVRIPKLDPEAPNQSNALRVLLCFTEKTHKHRMMGRKKDVECAGMLVETLEALPAEFLEISEEDRHAFESGDYEMADEVGEDEDGEDDHENYDEDGKKLPKAENGQKGNKKDDEPELPKKKVYEDEDEKAPFEVTWEGAPEFQWRICDGVRDEKKLIIDNLLLSDIYNPFIYRCIQHATSTELSFPARYSSDSSRATYGRMTVIFPGWVQIMDEALKHLIYFRSGDGRRIKIYLPQTSASLSKKDEFESKLGRLIKPTPRMKELVVKILPDGYIPTLDDACAWFPFQSVIGCEAVNDEMGNSCAIVKFETAEEAVAAHSGKSFVVIKQEAKNPDSEGSEKETTKVTNCNIFMRGVEAHFGSLLTFYDQKKRMLEEREAKKKEKEPASAKRPAGSTIRGPAKRGRGSSPSYRGSGSKFSSPRGRRGRGGPVRRASPPPRRPPPKSTRGGRGDTRSRNTFRGDSYGSSRAPARGDPFGSYGYSQFDSRYADRSTVDPFGRPLYGVGSNSYSAPFEDSSRGFSGGYDSRRRY